MATYDYGLKYTIYNYGTDDLTEIPEAGEKRYFDTIITGSNSVCHVIGDGSSQVNALPFQEPVFISAAANVDLEDLRITGNRVIVYNAAGSTITVEIGTSGASNTINLLDEKVLEVLFDGTNWKRISQYAYNSHRLGDLYLLPSTSKSTGWTLSAGQSTSFTDVDFSSEISTPANAVVVQYYFNMIGDSIQDNAIAYARKNGSTETNAIKTELVRFTYTNLSTGLQVGPGGQAVILCDTGGVAEYKVTANGKLFLKAVGYYKEW